MGPLLTTGSGAPPCMIHSIMFKVSKLPSQLISCLVRGRRNPVPRPGGGVGADGSDTFCTAHDPRPFVVECLGECFSLEAWEVVT